MMTRFRTLGGLALIFGLLLCPGSMFAVRAADTLSWNTNQNKVTADIRSSELLDVLEHISASTGWQVFVEPDTLHKVSTKFQNVAPGEALRMLLGDVNFALVPDPGAKTRLFVFRTSRQNATQLVRSAKPATARAEARVIPNELIVRLKPGAKIEDIAKLLGAKVIGRIDGLNAYRLQFEDQFSVDSAREQLASNPDVTSVENNYAFDRPETPVGVANANAATPQLQLKPPPESGKIIVGLVDTAVQSLGNGLDKFTLKPISIAGDVAVESGSITHGTAMLKTIFDSLQAVTKGSTSVQVLPIDVYGADPTTSSFNVAKGIQQAVDGGAKVINLSLGSSGDTLLLHDVIQQANQLGIAVFAAKGNQPVTTPFYPAAYAEATAVTALDPKGQIASYANRADIPAVGAPGDNLVTLGTQTFGVEGTSVSSAFVSGLAAGYMDVNQKSAADAKAYVNSRLTVKGSGQ